MADLAITPSDVSILATIGPDGNLSAGEVIDAGEAIYEDIANDNVAKLAQSDGTIEEATVKGIAVNSAEKIGQRVSYVSADDVLITISNVATKGTPYFLSNNPGKIAPFADLSTDDYVVPLVVASLGTELTTGIHNTGIQKA